MRPFKLVILFLILIIGESSADLLSMTQTKGLGFFRKSGFESDTTDIYRYTRLALASRNTKKQQVQDMKAYIDTAELICKQRDIEIPALLHLARAEYFFITSDFNNASQEAEIAMKLSKDSGEQVVLARTMNFLGRYSHKTRLFNEGIDYYNKSIDIAKKNKLNSFIPNNYRGISDIYYSLGKQMEYRDALLMMIDAAILENDTAIMKFGYYILGTSITKMIDEAIYENDTNDIASGYYMVGTSLVAIEPDFIRADSFLNESLRLSLLTKDSALISSSYANIGYHFYLDKKYDNALELYNRSLLYSLPAKLFSAAANSYGNMGTIYRDMDDVESSLQNYMRSIESAKIENDIYDLQWVYRDMSKMYLRINDTSKAYLSYVLFKRYSDSLIIASNKQGLMDARIQYEADTHNKEVELLSLRIKNQRITIYAYTGLFILTLMLGILILNRSKINTKRRISEMNRKISEVTQANLRQQMNPHFIFNTLNSIQYYMYQHDKLATNNYLTKFSSLMRKVLENSQHTSVPVRDELDALILYLDLEKIRFKNKFDYSINVDEEIDSLLYKIPTMLIQPYVENSICHGLMPGEGNGLVKIDLKLKKDYISCTIEDNGIGRKAAHEKKSKCDGGHNSLGTQIISSRLDLVNTLYGTSLKTVYTDLTNDKGEAEGTRVEIHIPILS